MTNLTRRASVLALAGFVVLAVALSVGAQTPASPKPLLNVNTATQVELEALPGIGPSTAKKIIAARPFAAVADLSKAGVPAATLKKITSLVTVGAAAPVPATTPAAAAPAKTTPPAAAPAKTGAAEIVAQTPPAPGMVWVNTSSKVFHREGDRYFGKTKQGKFMTEADAVKAGFREAKPAGGVKKK